MLVMVANQTGVEIGYMAGRFPGRVGHLYSPGAQRGPWPYLPYALDNGAYVAWTKGRSFDFDAWRSLLAWAHTADHPPVWALVPDQVANRDRTIEMWHQHAGAVTSLGFRPAFAVQDGMVFDDVPSADCVLFLGGSTKWKETAIGPWCARFPGRVHVGRVNAPKRLTACYRAGAISVDGTGWYHRVQREQLIDFIRTTPTANDNAADSAAAEAA